MKNCNMTSADTLCQSWLRNSGFKAQVVHRCVFERLHLMGNKETVVTIESLVIQGGRNVTHMRVLNPLARAVGDNHVVISYNVNRRLGQRPLASICQITNTTAFT